MPLSGLLQIGISFKNSVPDNLGIYAHAQSYGDVLKTINKAFARTINPVTLETFVADEDISPVKFSVRVWSALILAGGIVVVLFAREFLEILTHGKFVDAAPLISVWVYLMFSHTLGLVDSQYLIATKQTQAILKMQLIIPLLFIPLTGVATYSFGIMGAAICIVFSNFCLQCLFIHKAQQMGSSYKDHLSVFWSGLFLAVFIAFHTYATGLSLMVMHF